MIKQENEGVVVKNYNSYYYVDDGKTVIPCKVRGRFKKEKFSLLTGDKVVFSLDPDSQEGNIEEILPRKNRLLRPAVANVDQIALVFAVKEPDFNQNVFDRFLVNLEQTEVPVLLCFTKADLMADKNYLKVIEKTYEKIGYPVFLLSSRNQTGLAELQKVLQGKITVFSGLSGAGKSTLLNTLYPWLHLSTGEVSEKNKRGRHTTRFSHLFSTGEGYLVDTPGFSFNDIQQLSSEKLRRSFKEFARYENSCRFQGCLHSAEPDCAVKEAVAGQAIDELRYRNYLALLEEVKEKEGRKYK